MRALQVSIAVAVTVLYTMLSCLDAAVYAVSSEYDAREKSVEGCQDGWSD